MDMVSKKYDTITPSFLKPGDCIRIVSPAGKVDEHDILPAVHWLEQQGYRVKPGKNMFARHFQFAGTDAQRLSDLQESIDDPDTAAILCSRGGYGTIRIASRLDYTNLLRYPKWIIGFSDITILHAQLNRLRIASVHGAMPRHYFGRNHLPNENLRTLMNLLSGGTVTYTTPSEKENRYGIATGELTGGNLSIVASLMGTPWEVDTQGKILLIEDINEYLYQTDRMMHQLKEGGKLENLAGLLVGDFTRMKDNQSPFGKGLREIISEAVAGYDYPVSFGFPAGHDKKNLALTFGVRWNMEVTHSLSQLKNTHQETMPV